jgi:hypothetical protein
MVGNAGTFASPVLCERWRNKHKNGVALCFDAVRGRHAAMARIALSNGEALAFARARLHVEGAGQPLRRIAYGPMC